MGYGDFKDLNRRTDADNVLLDKALFIIIHYNIYIYIYMNILYIILYIHKYISCI